MIIFEHGMLVLSGIMDKEDVNAVNEFAEHVRNKERERIIELIEKWWHEDETNHIGLIALIKGENK